MGATYAPYHLRAVHLIWMLEQGSSHHHVESLIAQSLSSPESRNVYDAYEAFGVLWRLTGQSCPYLIPHNRSKLRQMTLSFRAFVSRFQC